MRDDLPQAMRETARQLEPDVVRLAAGGVTRGTRMRRLKRGVQVLGSALAVAVVFAAVVVFGSHPTGGVGVGVGAGGTPTTSTPTPGQLTNSLPGTPTATAPTADIGTGTGTGTGTDAQDAGTPASTGAPQVTGNELISTLKSRFQGTGVTGSSYLARGSDLAAPANMMPLGMIMVSARLSTQQNIGSIAIIVSGHQGTASGLGTPQAVGGGSTVYVNQAPGGTDGPQPDHLTLDVTLVRADGSSLTAIETNSPNDKSPAAPGAPLLLTSDQVTTLLDSSVWDAAIAAAKALPDQEPTLATYSATASG
ncbi:hypothetical protein ABH935_004944 [Catenulispora sp. GAS73]|uniref:hypothetical protein n=1 Tax=Catenulispora sp. GAS73 TaxID=3156269 RepID=UPI003513819A